MIVSKLHCLILFLSITLTACGLMPVKWHSIEQIPSDSVAYIRGGVFVSGEYMRSATITEIDGKAVIQPNNNPVEIELGQRKINIYCGEAEGEFNSQELEGKEKTLVLNAQLQRTYVVRCEPYSHWWIEDLDSKAVIAGNKFIENKRN